jgi:hypothetical protein
VFWGPGPGATPTPPELAEACGVEELPEPELDELAAPDEPPEPGVDALAVEAVANPHTAQPTTIIFATRTVCFSLAGLRG